MFTLALLLAQPALAHPTPDGWEEPSRHVYRPPPPALVVPETYAGVVAELKVRASAAEAALATAKILDLHRATDAIGALADALPEKAAGMKEDLQKAVAEKALDLRKQAEQVRASADAGDLAAAQSALSPLKADLDALAKVAL